MTKTECNWCNGLTAITVVLGVLLSIETIYVAFQEHRIVQIEDKNDAIVEMRLDMTYLKDGFKEIKGDVKLLLRHNLQDDADGGTGSFSIREAAGKISGN